MAFRWWRSDALPPDYVLWENIMSEYNRRKVCNQKRRENKKILLVLATATVIVIILLLTLLGGGSRKNEILGSWKYDKYTEYEFSKKGSGCLCVDDVHYAYQYETQGNKLKLDFTEDVVRDCEYTFTVKGDTLTLKGGEGTDGGTYELKKVQ